MLLLTFVARGASSDKAVRGEFTYFGDKNESREQCRMHALEGARLQALAREFGTVVSQDTYQVDQLSGREESTYFSQLNSTAVKGEWLADDGEPQYEYSLDSDGCYVVKCVVRGHARAISNEAVDFQALVLRNGIEERHAGTEFRNGDDMYLLLRTPVDGYVAVFLADDKRSVYSLLPYQNDNSGEVKVKRNKEYVFFSADKALPEYGVADELQLTTDQTVERNRIYVLFSPNPFSRAMDRYAGENIPRMLGADEFSAWLSKVRRNDPKMGVKIVNINISNH